MASQRRDSWELIGELVREGGLLSGVFGFLDWLFAAHRPALGLILVLSGISLLVIVLGLLVERYR